MFGVSSEWHFYLSCTVVVNYSFFLLWSVASQYAGAVRIPIYFPLLCRRAKWPSQWMFLRLYVCFAEVKHNRAVNKTAIANFLIRKSCDSSGLTISADFFLRVSVRPSAQIHGSAMNVLQGRGSSWGMKRFGGEAFSDRNTAISTRSSAIETWSRQN